MGRAPCCDKANVKRGPWSPEEDSKLKSYIDLHGTGGNWIALPQKIGLRRCGKSCRLRWLNYLRPNIKHGAFSEEEDNLICSLYISIGSRWSIIAAQLPGRTDNDIKNYWNTRLKKKLLGKHRKDNHQASMARISLKQQEIKVDFPVALDQQSPYWPELPSMPNYSSSSLLPGQEVALPSFNDHASIRKLLIKLGGRFHPNQVKYDINNNHQETNVAQTKIQDVHQLPVQFPIYHDEFAQMEHHNNNGDAMIPTNMFRGQSSNNSSLSNELNVDPEKLDGLEFLYGDDIMIMMNDRPIGSNTTRLSDERIGNGWSGSYQIYAPPSIVASGSDYDEGMQRLGMPQEQCADFSYAAKCSYLGEYHDG